MDQGYWIRF